MAREENITPGYSRPYSTFEYLIESHDLTTGQAEVSYLDDRGFNGWQLVTRTAIQLTGPHGIPRTEVTFIFMREVQA